MEARWVRRAGLRRPGRGDEAGAVRDSQTTHAHDRGRAEHGCRQLGAPRAAGRPRVPLRGDRGQSADEQLVDRRLAEVRAQVARDVGA